MSARKVSSSPRSSIARTSSIPLRSFRRKQRPKRKRKGSCPGCFESRNNSSPETSEVVAATSLNLQVLTAARLLLLNYSRHSIKLVSYVIRQFEEDSAQWRAPGSGWENGGLWRLGHARTVPGRRPRGTHGNPA